MSSTQDPSPFTSGSLGRRDRLSEFWSDPNGSITVLPGRHRTYQEERDLLWDSMQRGGRIGKGLTGGVWPEEGLRSIFSEILSKGPRHAVSEAGRREVAAVWLDRVEPLVSCSECTTEGGLCPTTQNLRSGISAGLKLAMKQAKEAYDAGLYPRWAPDAELWSINASPRGRRRHFVGPTVDGKDGEDEEPDSTLSFLNELLSLLPRPDVPGMP